MLNEFNENFRSKYISYDIVFFAFRHNTKTAKQLVTVNNNQFLKC